MISFSKKTIETSNIDTVIGVSANVEGTLKSSCSIRVDGKHTGDVFCESDVVVGENGLIKGNINANNVSISGKVYGNIKCSGLLEILSGGLLTGDINVQSITINDGAIFKGNCCMAVEAAPVEDEFKETII